MRPKNIKLGNMRKKFNRYKFDFTAYALTFDFLSSEEKVSMAHGLAAVWKQHRPNPQESKTYDALRVPKKTERTVCVKAVDVFGFESMVIEKLK